MRERVAAGLALIVTLAALALMPTTASAATCADYQTQAEAQRAADTRDADGDAIYCESLPCPCSSTPGGDGSSPPRQSPAPEAPTPPASSERSCVRPGSTQAITFSRRKYPRIRAHYKLALRRGWPGILVVNRRSSDARRERVTGAYPPRAGFDRDEYPPAIGRGAGREPLRRGSNPIGWRASIAYVPSSENRSHGATLGNALRRFCNGTRFRYVFE